MRIPKKILLNIVLLANILAVGSVAAYESDDDKRCRKPKFRDFEPAKFSEVAPGSEISFHVSGWADPETIQAEAKDIPMKLNIDDKMNFFIVTGHLPETLNNEYARVSISALAKDGRCKGRDGWLLKVKAAATEQTAQSAETTETPTTE